MNLTPGVNSESDYKLIEQKRQGYATEKFQTLMELPFILLIWGTMLNG